MQLRDRSFVVALAIVLSVPGVHAQSVSMAGAASGENVFPSLQFASAKGTKSVMLAIGASLLLPGLGEYYAGTFSSSGKYALTAEGVIWVTYTAFQMHGTWLKDDARSFAMDRAGVSFDGKDTQFEVDLGNFMTVQDYNETKLRNRQTQLLYADPSYSWVWSNDDDRVAFKDQRIRGDRILEASKFIIAAAVVNRLISAFSAGRAAASHNRAARARFSFDMDYIPEVGLPRREGAIIRLAYSF